MAESNSLNANAKRVAENEEINEWEAGNIGGVISVSHFHANGTLLPESSACRQQ